MSSETAGASGLAGRYATALFEMAESGNQIDQVSDDLQALDAMLADSEDLQRLVRSPVLSREDQARAIAALAEKAGLSDLTRRFLGVVAANRRLFGLSSMIRGFRDLVALNRGEATAEVVSAKELTDAQMTAVGDALKEAVGKAVTVEASVDPDLLGGLVVKVGSRMVDSSLRTKLQQLRLSMIGVG